MKHLAAILIALSFYYSSYSQCAVGEQCLNTGSGTTTFNYVKLNFTTANTTVTNDPISNNGILQTAKAVNAGCVTVSGVTTNIDVLVTLSMTNPANPETYTTGLTVQANGSLSFNGTANNSYTFKTEYFVSGTNTPATINTLQQVADIDGDADYNSDGVKDDMRAIVDNFQGNRVSDDYAWASGYTYANTNTNTLIYTGTGAVAGATYFYSSGTDNLPFTAISTITPNASSQNFILAWQNKSSTSFGYFSGQFGGVAVNYTGTNYAVSSCNISISGTVFDDANGNTIQDAGESGTNSGSTMYAYLVNSSGIVVASTTVAANGTYTLTATPNSNYTIKISPVQYSSGTNGNNINTTPPAGWVITGENGSGSGTGDGTPDGALAVTTTNVNRTGQNFGIERTPTATPLTYTHPSQPDVNTVIALNGTAAPLLNGRDPEDQPTAGALTGKRVQITSLPANGQLLYKGSPILYGADGINPPSPANPFNIASMLTTDLSVRLTGSGYTSTSFNYRYVDAAGAPSPPVTYTLNWTNALPVTLIRFTASAAANCGVQLDWQVAIEENMQYYGIEVADDGVHFESAAKVMPQGKNSSYTYLYEKAEGIKYFRLKMVNADNTWEYSKVLRNGQNCNEQAIRVYPTITKNQTMIEGLKPGDDIRVMNAAGSCIINIVAAQSREKINLNAFASGNYIIMITTKDTHSIQHFKLTKM